MKLRRLQRKDEEGQWDDDSYAYEDSSGQVIFCYHLGWERTGSEYNGKLQDTGVSLEEIETVLNPGKSWRWLPAEVIPDDQAEAYLEELHERCAIPKLRPLSITNRLDDSLVIEQPSLKG